MKMKLEAPLKAEVFRPTSNPKCGKRKCVPQCYRGRERGRKRARREGSCRVEKNMLNQPKCLKSYRHDDCEHDDDDYDDDDDGQIKMFLLVSQSSLALLLPLISLSPPLSICLRFLSNFSAIFVSSRATPENFVALWRPKLGTNDSKYAFY